MQKETYVAPKLEKQEPLEFVKDRFPVEKKVPVVVPEKSKKAWVKNKKNGYPKGQKNIPPTSV